MSINIGYFISEAGQSFRRNLMMTVGSIVTSFLSLLIIGTVLVGGAAVDSFARDVEAKVTLQILIRQDSEQADIDALTQTLQANPEVKSVGFTTKEQALENFKGTLGSNEALIAGLEESNPLPPSIDVELHDPKQVTVLADQVLSNPTFLKIADVPDNPASSLKYGQQIVERLFAVTRIMRYVGIALVALLSVIAVVFINNTIRLAIYARRREIGIMRLVGASNGFIRAPFLIEGALQAFIGALLAVAVVALVVNVGIPSLAESLPWFQIGIPRSTELRIDLILILSGVIIGLIGSTLAMRRYLRV